MGGEAAAGSELVRAGEAAAGSETAGVGAAFPVLALLPGQLDPEGGLVGVGEGRGSGCGVRAGEGRGGGHGVGVGEGIVEPVEGESHQGER